MVVAALAGKFLKRAGGAALRGLKGKLGAIRGKPKSRRKRVSIGKLMQTLVREKIKARIMAAKLKPLKNL